MHDDAEEERMIAIRKQGMNDFRDSGLKDRVPVGRKRRTSAGYREEGIHGSEGPEGLGPVEEVESVRSLER